LPHTGYPACFAGLLAAIAMTTASSPSADYSRWKSGPSSDPSFFPIAVWLQDPANAGRFKAAGINCYVGLWKGPTEEQLAALASAGMPVICEQNEVGLKHRDDRIIIGWMHGDEPDNAQSLGEGKEGYGPPVPAVEIVAGYKRIRKADPSRPVLLNLGQGVAWDNWYGRGVRTNHPEDYPGYINGCDIASFDIYPAVHDSPEVAGNLEYVGRGVERLVKWSGGRKIVWNCIEASRIDNEKTKPTARQVTAEVWMALIHGSRGLIYFVHQFKPKFIEASLLEDPELLPAVTAVNGRIRELAPVINAGKPAGLSVETAPSGTPIAAMARRHGGAIYVFAVAMRDLAVEGTFLLKGMKDSATAEVIGEGRTVGIADGRFTDRFAGYGVHIYRIPAKESVRGLPGRQAVE